ncbi:alpha/beta fold hydrolase [Pseudonocardia sp. DSM 110487]|uniref:alpha/beta fold hydrolase n=1 Tax=Pseudonocardia sp. DSM 110487 TaxID=2865833 RepID=UPI001C69B276|nr:alpha/beta hydrolase [Pseudonocardia sp. DSM 110487]QYN34237.1 alpha/beta fold hydrolase [Pseudonocardia sp. DSM 110487]
MERFVDVEPGVRLWAEAIEPTGPHPGEPLLLVMGANSSGLVWPDDLVAQLAEHHRVIRYDHRDTGRSTATFEDAPYSIVDLADDAIAVLDAFDVPRAHVVGMSMGGYLVQLMLLDHPDRIATATLFCTGPLPFPASSSAPAVPGPDQALLRLWAELDDPRDLQGEIAWRLEHWRLLNGSGTLFDPAEFRALEERVIAHSGRHDPVVAHARMDTDGMERGAELAGVTVPALVIEAPEDPAFPPPNAGVLARSLGEGRLVRIPGMGHAINRTVISPLAAAILTQTTRTAAAPA